MKSFVTYPRDTIDTIVLLDDTFAKSPHDVLLNTTLFDHQRTALAALIELENGTNEIPPRTLIINRAQEYSDISNLPICVESSAICYTDPFGSGKTYVLLALIVLVKVPNIYSIYNCGDNNPTVLFRTDYLRIVKNVIKSTFIVVNPTVLEYWENIIRTNSQLTVFIVSDYHKLCELRTIINDQVNYDIILVKSGIVTYRSENGRETKSIISYINNILGSQVVARAIYDDFDTMQYTFGNNMISALSTIIVSATYKYTNRVDNHTVSNNAIIPIPFNRINNDPLLLKLFNIRTDKKYIDASFVIPKLYSYKYVLQNKHDMLISCINKLNELTVSEMINSSAYATAAKLLGIDTTSVIDIFYKLLNNNYIRCAEYISTISKCQQLLNVRTGYVRAPDKSIEDIYKLIKSSDVPNFLPISDKSMIEKISKNTQRLYDIHSKNIRCALDNLRNGECQVCREMLGAGDIMIFRCCGATVCHICGFKGSQIKITKNVPLGKCVNCAANINIEHDIVMVKQNIDISMIANPPLLPINYSNNTELQISKLTILKQIIAGQTTLFKSPLSLDIDNLLVGKTVVPPSPTKKIVIYSGYAESIDYIHDSLIKEPNISIRKIMGTYKNVTRSLTWFNTTTYKNGAPVINVLLINSYNSCSGISLHMATDIVIYHKIFCTKTLNQIVGRVQRIGRTYNCQLHYLLYSNEDV